MFKQSLWIWPAIIGVTVAFVIVGIAIFLFGPTPGLVRQKFKLGSMIILLNAMLGACDGVPGPEVSCYDIADPDGGADSDSDGGTDGDTDTDVASDSDMGLDSDIIECYDVAESQMVIDLNTLSQNGEVDLDLSESNRLTGKIYSRMGSDFSFRITHADKTEAQSGVLEALDGTYDELTEEFEILVSRSLSSGTYKLHLYMTTLEDVQTYESFASATYTLNITNGNS